MQEKLQTPKKPNIFRLLKPYQGMIMLLVVLALTSNVLSLFLPKVISHGIDTFIAGTFKYYTSIILFSVLGLGVPTEVSDVKADEVGGGQGVLRPPEAGLAGQGVDLEGVDLQERLPVLGRDVVEGVVADEGAVPLGNLLQVGVRGRDGVSRGVPTGRRRQEE